MISINGSTTCCLVQGSLLDLVLGSWRKGIKRSNAGQSGAHYRKSKLDLHVEPWNPSESLITGVSPFWDTTCAAAQEFISLHHNSDSYSPSLLCAAIRVHMLTAFLIDFPLKNHVVSSSRDSINAARLVRDADSDVICLSGKCIEILIP